MSKEARVRVHSEVRTDGRGAADGTTTVDVRVVVADGRSSVEVRKLLEQAVEKICVQMGIPR